MQLASPYDSISRKELQRSQQMLDVLPVVAHAFCSHLLTGILFQNQSSLES
jgi:hypothetical protein